MEEVAAVAGEGPCLMCGDLDNPTVEHIIPQTLWNRFGIDPDREDLAVFRTTLCGRHNDATSVLHERTEMMELIDTGEPVTPTTLQHLSDWALWVTLLLGLARGSGVLGPEVSRELLLRRFDGGDGRGARGVRVYAARVLEYVDPALPAITPYMLALHRDTSVVLDPRDRPTGFTVGEGPINASESIGLGRVALLVVGRTYTSGPGHNDKLDQAAAQVGLERIHPLPAPLPTLTPRPVSMKDISSLFTVMPFGADLSLMPADINAMWASATDDEQGR